MMRLKPIAKAADVKEKEAAEALGVLVKDKLVDQWPAIKAYKITPRGLESVAAIESRMDTRFQWTWNKKGEQNGRQHQGSASRW